MLVFSILLTITHGRMWRWSFCWNGYLSIVGFSFRCFHIECGRRDATQERKSTHDDDRIKEEANSDAFIFDFIPYQSWKSRNVVFFQMLQMSTFVMWWRNKCRRRDTTCDMSESTHDDNNNDNDTTTINRK
jgi:hypothetical protein